MFAARPYVRCYGSAGAQAVGALSSARRSGTGAAPALLRSRRPGSRPWPQGLRGRRRATALLGRRRAARPSGDRALMQSDAKSDDFMRYGASPDGADTLRKHRRPWPSQSLPERTPARSRRQDWCPQADRVRRRAAKHVCASKPFRKTCARASVVALPEVAASRGSTCRLPAAAYYCPPPTGRLLWATAKARALLRRSGTGGSPSSGRAEATAPPALGALRAQLLACTAQRLAFPGHLRSRWGGEPKKARAHVCEYACRCT